MRVKMEQAKSKEQDWKSDSCEHERSIAFMCARAKNKRFLRARRCQPRYRRAGSGGLADIHPAGMLTRRNPTTDWQENRFSGIYYKCRASFYRGFSWVC